MKICARGNNSYVPWRAGSLKPSGLIFRILWPTSLALEDIKKRDPSKGTGIWMQAPPLLFCSLISQLYLMNKFCLPSTLIFSIKHTLAWFCFMASRSKVRSLPPFQSFLNVPHYSFICLSAYLLRGRGGMRGDQRTICMNLFSPLTVVCPGDGPQDIRLGSKCLFSLSHLASPPSQFLTQLRAQLSLIALSLTMQTLSYSELHWLKRKEKWL